MAPFANRGKLPMVPMFTNTLFVFCFINPLRLTFTETLWVTLYVTRINPLLLTFTNILWTILIFYLIDSLCCGWFLQTPCWYFVLSIPCGWFLQTPHGSLYILFESTPVVDFYKHPLGHIIFYFYQPPMVDFYQNPLGLLYCIGATCICAIREKLTNPPKRPTHFIFLSTPCGWFVYQNSLVPFVLHLYQPLWLVSLTKTLGPPYILYQLGWPILKDPRVNSSLF